MHHIKLAAELGAYMARVKFAEEQEEAKAKKKDSGGGGGVSGFIKKHPLASAGIGAGGLGLAGLAGYGLHGMMGGGESAGGGGNEQALQLLQQIRNDPQVAQQFQQNPQWERLFQGLTRYGIPAAGGLAAASRLRG